MGEDLPHVHRQYNDVIVVGEEFLYTQSINGNTREAYLDMVRPLEAAVNQEEQQYITRLLEGEHE